MHWKRTSFVLLILGLFFVIWNQIACKGICGAYQRICLYYISCNFCFYCYISILFFEAMGRSKEKYIEKDGEKRKTPEKGRK